MQDPNVEIFNILQTQLFTNFIHFAGIDVKDNVDDVITQSMHDLKLANGFDPCKNDVDVLKKALRPYGFTNDENIFIFDNDATLL